MMVHVAPDPTAPASTPRDASSAESQELELSATATLPVADVLGKLGSSDAGLSSAEASRRLGIYGPNVLAAHGVSAWSVLVRQLRSYLLLLLLVAAVVSAVVGDLTEALIIGAIMAMSIGLSFFNEYRSEKAVEELHSEIQHLAAVDRDGAPAEIAVTQLVPGDVVHLRVGDVIPADLRLLEVHELECDESVLTGESRATEKTAEAQPPGDSPLDLRSCAFMGTLVSGGGGRGVVVRTGSRTAFGAIAVRLGERQGVTAFQQGLQDFSRLLATVTAVLAGSIFVINVALGRSILQSALFALAIAVGLTPQLLPAIVTVSLATGARRLAKKRVIVKRLVAIEDLGNVQVLFTDKTGTLTQGQISFTQALDGAGKPDDHVRVLGLTCSDKTGNELDRALWAAPQDAHGDAVPTPLDRLPFDHERQLASVLVDTQQGRLLISKGAPEAVLARCATVPAQAQATLDGLFASGTRVVAVASRPLAGDHLGKDDEHDLSLDGFLCFTDPVKPDVKDSLARLARLGVTVKIVTGDNGQVAAHLCGEVGLDPGTVVTGQELEQARRRRPRRAAAEDDHLRPRHPGAEVAHHPRPAQPRLGRRLSRRRRQRRDRAPPRRRRHLGRLGGRRRQGRRGRRPARQGSRHPRRRCRRGPAHLRQHDQVRPDGHLVELREHVLRGRRVAVSSTSCRCCRRRSCSTTSSTTSAR